MCVVVSVCVCVCVCVFSSVSHKTVAVALLSLPPCAPVCCSFDGYRCFFSISQIAIMLFLIREQLILSWGRKSEGGEKKKKKKKTNNQTTSLSNAKKQK
jgi:hypothetical protein